MSKKIATYTLFNKSKNCAVASKAWLADNFFLRLKGLMFRKNMDRDEAVILYHTPSIHTFFMNFSIEVVFLNQKMRIVDIRRELKPKRVVFSASASIAIELPANKTSPVTLEVGDILALLPNPG